MTNVLHCDIVYIVVRVLQCDVSKKHKTKEAKPLPDTGGHVPSENKGGLILDAHIKKVYVPMTETGFYILLCLQKPNHGYGVVQMVERMTEGEIRLSPGTMYGSLSKMEKDKLIQFVREEEKRKLYVITELGREVLQLEKSRIKRLYRNSLEARSHEDETGI